MPEKTSNKTRDKITVGATVPMALVETIDEIIESGGGLYKDRAEFVRDALRGKISEFKSNR